MRQDEVKLSGFDYIFLAVFWASVISTFSVTAALALRKRDWLLESQVERTARIQNVWKVSGKGGGIFGTIRYQHIIKGEARDCQIDVKLGSIWENVRIGQKINVVPRPDSCYEAIISSKVFG